MKINDCHWMKNETRLFVKELFRRDLVGIKPVEALLKMLHARPNASTKSELLVLLRLCWLRTNKEISKAWQTKDFLGEKTFGQRVNSRGKNDLDIIIEGEKVEALDALKRVGYYRFKRKLDLSTLGSIRTVLHDRAGYIEELEGQKRLCNVLTREEALGREKLRYFYDATFLEDDCCVALRDSVALEELATVHLGNRVVRKTIEGWLSVGRENISSEIRSMAAQEFHFDLDSFNFLKVFIYISDVLDGNGPHQYIAGSHLPFSLSKRDLDKFPPYFRLSQKDIGKIFPDGDIVTQYGYAGTVVVEDTSGFHRGEPLEAGKTRDMIVLKLMDDDWSFG